MSQHKRLAKTSAPAALPIADHRRAFEKARDRLRQIPDELAAELDAIVHNWELPDETKRERTRKARGAAAREAEGLIAEAREALAFGAEQTQRMRTRRGVLSEQRLRVHRLLERGVTPGEILSRAMQLRDPETIAALRAELLWAGDTLVEGEAGGEIEELMCECDRGLALVSTGDEKAANTAAVNLRESAAGFDELAQLAVKAAAGGPIASERMKLGYAENADVV
jgi:predicted regulator of Ras-like GTPase activity (Roadblock/LC7/MglB family)